MPYLPPILALPVDAGNVDAGRPFPPLFRQCWSGQRLEATTNRVSEPAAAAAHAAQHQWDGLSASEVRDRRPTRNSGGPTNGEGPGKAISLTSFLLFKYQHIIRHTCVHTLIHTCFVRPPLSQRLAQRGPDDDLVPLQLLRKYIAYARQYCHPRLTDEARDVLQV